MVLNPKCIIRYKVIKILPKINIKEIVLERNDTDIISDISIDLGHDIKLYINGQLESIKNRELFLCATMFTPISIKVLSQKSLEKSHLQYYAYLLPIEIRRKLMSCKFNTYTHFYREGTIVPI